MVGPCIKNKKSKNNNLQRSISILLIFYWHFINYIGKIYTGKFNHVPMLINIDVRNKWFLIK